MTQLTLSNYTDDYADLTDTLRGLNEGDEISNEHWDQTHTVANITTRKYRHKLPKVRVDTQTGGAVCYRDGIGYHHITAEELDAFPRDSAWPDKQDIESIEVNDR